MGSLPLVPAKTTVRSVVGSIRLDSLQQRCRGLWSQNSTPGVRRSQIGAGVQVEIASLQSSVSRRVAATKPGDQNIAWEAVKMTIAIGCATATAVIYHASSPDSGSRWRRAPRTTGVVLVKAR